MLGLSQGLKLSMKRGYGVSWFISLGSCWPCRDHVGPFWAYVEHLEMFVAYLANFVARKSMLGLSLSGLMLSIWRMFVAYLSQLSSQKKHLNSKKLLLRSCCGRPWGHVGPISGAKIKHEKGVWVSWFICWVGVREEGQGGKDRNP